MTTLAFTEHIARDDLDLYPGEETHEHYSVGLEQTFDNYYREAVRLRSKYETRIKLLVGFETEWIRPRSLQIIEAALQKYRFDLFIGSIHHVHTVPIDYDEATYRKAREKAGGTDERLFADYFDGQYEMLTALKPPIVGHFDLIRLKSNSPDQIWTSMPEVWRRIIRNLHFVASYGGIIELNTSALRKGLKEPYPKAEICQAFMEMDGRFTLSDDSHGIDQIGTNYSKALDFIEHTGIKELSYLDKQTSNSVGRLEPTTATALTLTDLRNHAFWSPQT